MRSIWLVARREYLEQVRGRAFKMTTLGVPAIFARHHRHRLSLEPEPGLGPNISPLRPAIR